MREYGRNVQHVVEHALTIEDREQRNEFARGIIDMMAQLNPNIKTIDDWQHKLWDHLHIMADYRLDVDSPYPAPTREEVEKRPERVAYPEKIGAKKHYGKHLDSLIEKCIETEDEEKQQEFAKLIAGFMKMVHVNYNREATTDEQVKNDLKELSGGKIVLGEDVTLAAPDKPSGGNRRSSNKRNSGRGGHRKNNNRKHGGRRRR
jgi:hypothetical protein